MKASERASGAGARDGARGLDAEVLVVGGGPAGSATAARLAAAGRDVLLVDRASFPREKPCGEFFSPGVVVALQRLGAFDGVVRRAHERPLGMRVATERERFLVTYADSPPGPDGERGGLAMSRSEFDSALLDHARACGVRVSEGVGAIGPLTCEGRVVGVRARTRTVEVRELRAAFLVVADGANSGLARSLGLVQPTSWPRRLGLAAHYTGVEMDGRVGEMHVGDGLYCGIAPVGDGLVSVAMAAPMGAKGPGESVAGLFERLLTALPGAARTLGSGRRVGPIRGVGPMARRVSRCSGPGFLLVGDAAGFLDPFTGEGVHRALVGADLAAEAVDQALLRRDALPVGYDEARRRALASKELVCLLVQLFLSRPAAFGYVLRRLDRRPAAGSALSAVLGDYRPAASVLTPGFVWGLLGP